MTAEPSAAEVKRPFSPPRFAATAATAAGSARDPVKAPAGQENDRQQRVVDDDADEDDEDEEEDDDDNEEEAAQMPTSSARTTKPRAAAAAKKPRKVKDEPGDDDDKKSTAASKKSRRELPPHTVAILKGWMLSPEHVKHPYPTDEDKQMLLKKTGINMKQLTNWFTNARKRIWKPMMRREHSRQLQSAIEYEKTRPREAFAVAPGGAPQSHQFREGEFPVARGGPGVVRHSFDVGSLGPPRQQMPPPPPFDPYAPRVDGREVPVYPPQPVAGFVPRVVRSASEALPGTHVDDDYIDAMRIRKRVHERSPDGVEAETQGDKRFRRSALMSPRSLKILQDWVSTHPDFPFPTDPEKLQLSRDTGLDVQQIELWFTNNRERISAANFAVQNGAPGLSPSRRALPGRSIPSRDNPMFPPPMYSAGGEHHSKPHAHRSIPSNGNSMFPPRPTAAPMQQRSSIPGNGNPQFPPPPGRRELPEGYYPPPSYGSGQYTGHVYGGDAGRHVRSMSISTSQLMRQQQQPRPLLDSTSGQLQQPGPATPGAPSAANGLPSLTNRSAMARVANGGGPTMGQPRDGRSHTLDMGLFADARRRKMNFQDILASTTSVPSAQPQLTLRQQVPQPSQQQQPPPVSRPLSSVGMAENGSRPHSVLSGSTPEQQMQAYPSAVPAYGGVQSFERPHISGCPRCGARPGGCGCGVTDDVQQQQRRIV